MAQTATGTWTSGQLTDVMQTYFDARTLEVAEQNLPLGQFAVRRDLPPRSSKTINFSRYEKLTLPSAALTEATTPASPRDITVTTITATVDQLKTLAA
jgi:N4-gp56 family major capsid protein